MKTTKKESTEREKFCEFCDWTEDGIGTNTALIDYSRMERKAFFVLFCTK